jgi:hypothetical protein
LNFACSLKIKAVYIGVVHLTLLILLSSDPESILMVFFLYLESSGYKFQDEIKHPQQLSHFSLLRGTQMLLHILHGLKSSAKRGLKLLLFTCRIYCFMVNKDFNEVAKQDILVFLAGFNGW